MTIEIGLGTASAGVFLTKAASKDTIDFLYKWNIDETLRSKLETALLVIRAEVEHAELKQIKNKHLQKLLPKVNVAIYDAEDLLDEIASDALKSFIEKRNPGVDSKMKEIANAFHPFKETIEKRMRNMIENLDSLTNSMGRLAQKKIERNIDYGTGIVTSAIYGRNLDKMEIEKLLKVREKKQEFGVVPIVGMGGVGKTTLAKMVYESNELKFDFKAWINVTDTFDIKRITKSLVESTGNSCNFDDLDLLQSRLKKMLQGKKFLIVLDDMWSDSYTEWEVLKIPFSVGAPGSQIIVTTRNRGVGNTVGTVPFYTLKEVSDSDCWSLIEAIAFPNRDLAELPQGPELKKIGVKISKKCKGLPLAAITLGGLLRVTRKDVMQWNLIHDSDLWDLPADDKILPSLLVSYDHLPFEVKKCFVYCSMFPKGYRFEMEELVLLWMAEDLLPEHVTNKIEELGRMYFYLLRTQSFLQPMGLSETEFVMHDLMHDLALFLSSDLCLHLEDNLETRKVHEQCRHISHLRKADDVLAKFEPITSLEHLRTFLSLKPFLRIEFHYLSSDVLCVLPKFRKLRALSLSGYLIDELPESIGSLRHMRYLNLSYSLIKCLPDAVKHLYNLQTLILSQCRQLTSLHADLGNLTKLRHIDIVETDLRLMPLRMGSLKCLQTLSDFVIGDKVGSEIHELQSLVCLQGKLHISGLQNITTSEAARDAVLSNKEYLQELVLEWSSEDSEKHELEEKVLRELKPHANLKSLTITNFHGSEFPPWMDDSLFGSLVSICIDRCRQCGTLPSFGRLPSLQKLVLKDMDKVEEIGDDLWGNNSVSSWAFPSLQILRLQDMKNLCVWTSIGKNKIFPSLEELQIIDCPKLVKLTYCFPSLRKLQIERCKQLTGIWKPYIRGASLLDDYKFLRSISLVACPELKDIPKNIFELEMLAIDNCNPELKEVREDIVEEEETLNPDGCELNLSKLQKLFIYDSEMKLLFPQHSQEVRTRMPTNLCDLGFLRALSVFFARQLSQLRKFLFYDSQMDLISSGDFRFSALTLLDLYNVHFLDKLPETFIQGCPQLEELKITYCENLVSLAIEQDEEISGFSFLKRVNIRGCGRFQALPAKMIKFAPSIESLYVNDCQSLAKLPLDLHRLNSLQSLTFIKCRLLKAFPDTGLPTSLTSLIVRECATLKTFEVGVLSNCPSLEFMEIERCNKLVSLCENGDLPLSLKHLKIGSCECLSSLPIGVSETLSMNLIALEISDCNLVTSFPQGDLPPTLQRLVISSCSSLRSLPNGIQKLESLHSLEISWCPLIKQFPNWGLPDSKLKSLKVQYCEKLTSLPINFSKMGSLDELEITGCKSLVYKHGLPYNLKKLLLWNCEVLLSLHPLRLDTLSLLQILTINKIKGSVIFSESNRLPNSIIELNLIELPDLVLLPETPPVTTESPTSFSKLNHLYIERCPRLNSMPENGLPKSVRYLRVIKCPQLTPLCKETYWPKIKMIPNVEIE